MSSDEFLAGDNENGQGHIEKNTMSLSAVLNSVLATRLKKEKDDHQVLLSQYEAAYQNYNQQYQLNNAPQEYVNRPVTNPVIINKPKAFSNPDFENFTGEHSWRPVSVASTGADSISGSIAGGHLPFHNYTRGSRRLNSAQPRGMSGAQTPCSHDSRGPSATSGRKREKSPFPRGSGGNSLAGSSRGIEDGRHTPIAFIDNNQGSGLDGSRGGIFGAIQEDHLSPPSPDGLKRHSGIWTPHTEERRTLPADDPRALTGDSRHSEGGVLPPTFHYSTPPQGEARMNLSQPTSDPKVFAKEVMHKADCFHRNGRITQSELFSIQGNPKKKKN